MPAILSDSEEDEGDTSDKGLAHGMCVSFSSRVSTPTLSHEDCVHKSDGDELSVSSGGESEFESGDECELQKAFRDLYTETFNTKKYNRDLGRRVLDLEREKECLIREKCDLTTCCLV